MTPRIRRGDDAMASGTSAAAGAILLSRRCRMPGRWPRFHTGGYTGPRWVALMPFHLYGDELADDARWAKLAEGAEGQSMTQRRWETRLDTLQAAYFRISQLAAHQRDDGYVGHRAALTKCHGKAWVLEALTTPACGKGPFLHRPGDKCAEKNCIDSSSPWVDGFDYRVCGFLKRNPSKAEQERRKAQKDDSRDSRLRAFVYDRDGGCCRYCRSGPLNRVGMGKAKDTRRAPEFDHADPDKPAGPNAENLYLACKRCNRDKSDDGSVRRTVREFGWPLLPVPSEKLKDYWRVRGERLFDRPEPGKLSPADTVPDTFRDTPSDTDPTPVGVGVDTPVPTGVPDTSSAAVECEETAGGTQEHPSPVSTAMSGSGRVGEPSLGVGGQPVRDASSPDIYHGRSRAPVPRAGSPP